MKKNKKKVMKKASSPVHKGKIVPLGDRVLLRQVLEENAEKTKSGIFIPDTVQKEKSEEGVVVAVGEGRYEDGKLVPLKVKVGDKVLYSKYGYDEIKVDGKDYFILKEENILAIIK
jgi:chaperonin GroES